VSRGEQDVWEDPGSRLYRERDSLLDPVCVGVILEAINDVLGVSDSSRDRHRKVAVDLEELLSPLVGDEAAGRDPRVGREDDAVGAHDPCGRGTVILRMFWYLLTRRVHALFSLSFDIYDRLDMRAERRPETTKKRRSATLN